MAILKKNLTTVIMGVLAALAVVGVYVWPIPKLYDKLTAEMHQSLTTGSGIQSMLTASRSLPVLSPDPNITAKPLEGFPNESAVNAAEKAIAAFKDQADKVLQQAVKINQGPHPFLVVDELPKPDDTKRYDYQKKYGDETTNYAHWQFLNFTARPTPDAIQSAKDAMKAQIDKSILVYDTTGAVTEQSRHEADNSYNHKVDFVEGGLDQERAGTFSVYLEDKALLGVDPKLGQINQGQAAPQSDKIFDTQLALWCADDITHAIKRCNDAYCDVDATTGKPKNDILHNPIKQIEMIGPPVPTITGTATGTPVKQVTASQTARCCNSLYDVVAYTVRLVVDGDKVPLVIRELQAGQFITVLKVQILQVEDPAYTAGNGFRFGDKPCVEIEMQVEELFLHQWTDPIFPDSRKTGMGGNANANGQIDTSGGDTSGGNPTDPSLR